MDRLGRYQIIEEVGRGGMGAVYRAVDPAIGRQVAIKTILFGGSGTNSESAQLRARLLREAQAAGTLMHPNIVTVFDMGEDGGTAYIVMEFILGKTLEQMVESAKLPLDQALNILAWAARALDYAHERGIIHRDVKPANIMVQTDGTVKLADFGIAKVVASDTVTPANSVVGSPHFLSPEQLRAEAVTARSDQYSLGVVAFFLITGRKPFHADSIAALFTQIIMQDMPPDAHLNATSDAVLRRALAKDPSQRFENCSTFVKALRHACIGPTQETPIVAPPPARKNRVWLILSLALVVVAIAGASVWFVLNQRPQPTATRTNPTDGLEYVWIAPGSFTMGCSPGDTECSANEKPPHEATIKAGFWMGRTEVTVGAYKRFAEATVRDLPP